MGGGVEGEGPRWKIGRLVGRRGGWRGGEPGERKKEQLAGNLLAIEMLNAKCKQTLVTLVMRNIPCGKYRHNKNLYPLCVKLVCKADNSKNRYKIHCKFEQNETCMVLVFIKTI